jgi:hypothetical protein
MSPHRPRHSTIHAVSLVTILAAASPSFADPSEIALPGDHAYPESISAAPDGTLYVGSLAAGGVWRIKPQSGTVEEWIKPSAFGIRSLLGVLVDSKANLLWICSNDFSSSGIPGPSVSLQIVALPGSFALTLPSPDVRSKPFTKLPVTAIRGRRAWWWLAPTGRCS